MTESSRRSGIGVRCAFEGEAAAGGEAAAFGFVRRGNAAVGVLGADAEGWIERIEVARVEGRSRSWGNDGDCGFGRGDWRVGSS